MQDPGDTGCRIEGNGTKTSKFATNFASTPLEFDGSCALLISMFHYRALQLPGIMQKCFKM